MFGLVSISNSDSAKMAAIQKAHAVIEFQPDGTIITANDSFLNLMGYRLDDVRGKASFDFCCARRSL